MNWFYANLIAKKIRKQLGDNAQSIDEELKKLESIPAYEIQEEHLINLLNHIIFLKEAGDENVKLSDDMIKKIKSILQ